MKYGRFFIFVVILVLFFSAWVPASVAAKAETTLVAIGASSGDNLQVVAAKDTIKLIVQNKTGGTVFVRLVGEQSYSFAATNQGKTTFMIKPGKYTYTITASNCGGSISKTKNLKGATTLGPFFCNNK